MYCFPHFCGFGICGAGKSGKDEKPRLREGEGDEEALGKVLPEIGAKPGDVRGDLCPNDTLCVQLQLGKNKLFDTCARLVAKDIFVSCPVLICS